MDVLCSSLPRIFLKRFNRKANTAFFSVEAFDVDFNFVTDFVEIGRFDATIPGNFRDMNKA